jgi:hypothetical protein
MSDLLQAAQDILVRAELSFRNEPPTDDEARQRLMQPFIGLDVDYQDLANTLLLVNTVMARTTKELTVEACISAACMIGIATGLHEAETRT